MKLMQIMDQSENDLKQGFANGSTGSSSSPASTEPQTQMDVYKACIYRHPLFPLLALLFEKCEQSTQGSDCVTSASFNVDIENFVRSQEKDGKAFFSEDPDLDNLMVKAIQVLRIHLLELEKVSDLCKDFCSRYITCLKTKMNSETLLSGEAGSPYSPGHDHLSHPFSSALSPQGVVASSHGLQQGSVTVTTVNPSQMVAGNAVYQPVTVVTPQGQVVTQAISPGTIHIQNSQVWMTLQQSTHKHVYSDSVTSDSFYFLQLQLQLNQDLSFFGGDDNSPKNKRGVLPKQATSVMRSWLFQHIAHPYPTEEEKKQIATQTNLTLLQVNNWFINARRRILQPMLDVNSEMAKSKKKTPPSRPLHRFWSDSIASSGTQQQLIMPDGSMVTVGMNVDGFQALSSDGATLSMQQVMMGNHSEDESEESGNEDEADLSSANMPGLDLDISD
ncbi:homeobox protein PKNOX1.1 isoform X2 [Carassius carassius]|uniref:homeobox protein PKNOX1.1 isoform X2 n=1 Tax=Carassius carassius TaxID=217509 RepID=UPI002868F2B7|nr:homeobox protein PKNOX1.1 isoform X2 [Carassius carassius]